MKKEELKDKIKELSDSLVRESYKDYRQTLFVKRASCYQELGERALAVSDYLDAIEMTNDARIISHCKASIALMFLEQGDKEKALWWSMDATSSWTDSVEANFAVGLVLSHGELCNLASSFFQKVLSIEPTNLLACLELGKCQREEMEFEQAIATFERLISIDSNNSVAHYELAWTWHLNFKSECHLQKAVFHYEQSLELNPLKELKEKLNEKLKQIRDL